MDPPCPRTAKLQKRQSPTVTDWAGQGAASLAMSHAWASCLTYGSDLLPLRNNHATALIKRAHGQSQSLLPEANPLEDLLQLLCACSLSTLPSSETTWTQKARPLFAVWEALLSNIIAVLKEWGFKLGENIWSGFMLSLRHQGLFSGMLVTHSSSWSQRHWRVNTLVLIRDVVSQTQWALKACHENLGLGSQIPSMSKASNRSWGISEAFCGSDSENCQKAPSSQDLLPSTLEGVDMKWEHQYCLSQTHFHILCQTHFHILCPAYSSSHFQQEWPYCFATAQKSHRCKNKVRGTKGRGPVGKRDHR